MERAIGTPPQLTILERQANADLQREKQWLTEPVAADGLRHLALIVLQPDAVVAGAGGAEYGSYELFIPQNIDDRLETELYDAIRESLVAARISDAQPQSRRSRGGDERSARGVGDRQPSATERRDQRRRSIASCRSYSLVCLSSAS